MHDNSDLFMTLYIDMDWGILEVNTISAEGAAQYGILGSFPSGIIQRSSFPEQLPVAEAHHPANVGEDLLARMGYGEDD